MAYDDGTVVLHRGDVTKEKGTRLKVLMEPGPTVAGLAFKVGLADLYVRDYLYFFDYPAH